ncbi:MAG: hypothetical protein JW834_04950 [Candidatus Diapherotrites archaeon]|nr:hypothetical protein [Candidatus Diapherotrites archaeon]
MRITLLLLMLAAASAAVNITFNPSATQYLLPGGSLTITVTVTNLENYTDNHTIYLITNSSLATIEGDNSTKRVAGTNVAPNASTTISITYKMRENATYDSTTTLSVQVSDMNHTTVGNKEVLIGVPEWEDLNLEYTYNAESTPNKITLNATARTDNINRDYDTHFNITYYKVHKHSNASDICASGSISSHTGDVDITNCSGIVDLFVNVTRDGVSKWVTEENVFIIKNITLNASLYALELFDYEQPFELVKYVAGNKPLRIKGTALYGDGTPVGASPDTEERFVNMTFRGNTTTKRIDSDGSFRFDFFSQPNASTEKAEIRVQGIHNLVDTKSFDVIVNLTHYLPSGNQDVSAIKSKITIMSVNNGSAITANGSTVIPVEVSNENAFSISAKANASHPQFDVETTAFDQLTGNKNSTLEVTITPKAYTRPGTYNMSVGVYTSSYGEIMQDISVTVPEEPFADKALNVRRYVDYGNKVVAILLKNTKASAQNITVRETISKAVAQTASAFLAKEEDDDEVLGEAEASLDEALAGEGSFECNLTVNGVNDHYWVRGTNLRNATAVVADYVLSYDSVTGLWNRTDITNTTVRPGGAVPNATNVSCIRKHVNASWFELPADKIVPALPEPNISFTTPITRIVEDDPIVEWVLELGAGRESEIAYSLGMEPNAELFSEPEVIAGSIGAEPGTDLPPVNGVNVTDTEQNITTNETSEPTVYEEGEDMARLAMFLGGLAVILFLTSIGIYYYLKKMEEQQKAGEAKQEKEKKEAAKAPEKKTEPKKKEDTTAKKEEDKQTSEKKAKPDEAAAPEKKEKPEEEKKQTPIDAVSEDTLTSIGGNLTE